MPARVPDVERDRYEEARRRVADLRGFYLHAVAYALGNVSLFLINWLADQGGTWWFQWPLLGWSVGLAIHAAGVYGRGALGSEWEQRRIQRYLDQHGRPPLGRS